MFKIETDDVMVITGALNNLEFTPEFSHIYGEPCIEAWDAQGNHVIRLYFREDCIKAQAVDMTGGWHGQTDFELLEQFKIELFDCGCSHVEYC